MLILGYIASILIGISLGLIGSGGSILTVPVLVYLFSVDAVAATAYSLFIVGFTSALGSVAYLRKGLVDLRTAAVFGTPSIVAVFLTRAYLVPAIPQTVFNAGGFAMSKGMMLMVLFALLMIAASYSMIRKGKAESGEENRVRHFNYALILMEGIVVGVLTGLVGAGGGFLIIPALVLLSGLPMKKAVGTSLLIIAAKSLIGFFGEHNLKGMDWQLLTFTTLVASVGIFVGAMLSRRIDGARLKPAFGWFVLVMGVYIIIKETWLR
ncbi:MAG TPA: sulfite exporter TauE/SafE family protein [Bacteroidia bacterium]|nr:sulfite exporter TauE/SafE family protein [Bacteroidia bacterium]